MKNHATSHARFHRMPFAAALAVAIVSGTALGGDALPCDAEFRTWVQDAGHKAN